jgi:hypothetical protein
MKKETIILITACLLFSLASKAQFSRGTIMVGTTIGTSGFSDANSNYMYDVGTLKSTGTNTFTFSAGPQIGVFLSPHLVFGATPSVSLSTSHVNTTTTNTNNSVTGSSTSTTTTTFSIGPFLRYYLLAIPGNNWLYLQANGAIGSGTGSSSGNSYTTTALTNTSGKISGILNWNTGASLGLTHLFYRRIGLDLAFGYNYSHTHNYNVNNTFTTNKSSGNITASTNNYTLNTGTNGLTFGFGFHWFLKG